MTASSDFAMPPPPSAAKINLAIADLVIYAILFFPVIWIAWKYGKKGMVCWPIFVTYFPLRFVSDAWQVAKRNEPEIPNTVAIMTNAGSIACLSLTLIGMVYEVNILLPLPPKRWVEKIMLGVMHLAMTAGIGLATYGGAPSPDHAGGVVFEDLNHIGNCLMLFAMLFGLGGWIWTTGKRVLALKSHPNFLAAKYLLIAACAALPFQLVRLGHSLTYAFTPYPVLDPITGTFATRLIIMFGMQLVVAIIATVGGWFSMDTAPAGEWGLNPGFSSV
ncbi:hypothetical protein B0T11DRAFT_59761 [Plectosphaerella cucumerina]|uniref:DUF7702 domain-containing protein n=1 Tax=Plectosphaerella cucumerina TaxID=40658 RepID=A0A8K0TJR2_9PEZI|nr:hypothetical protein B0T11DRAFT_59761 [Plectosphaerella cucumerina]